MNRKHFVLAVLVTALFVFTIGATWVVAQNDGVIQACVGPQGQLRIVKSEAECRPSEEDFIAWNIVGPKGDQGDPGPQGPPGPPAEIEAFAAGTPSVVSLPFGVEKDVLSVDVPAGIYMGDLDITGTMYGVEGRSHLECHFEYIDSSGRHDIEGEFFGGHFFTFPAQDMWPYNHSLAFEEPTEVIIACEVVFQEPDEPPVVVDIIMFWTLIKVDRLNGGTPFD